MGVSSSAPPKVDADPISITFAQSQVRKLFPELNTYISNAMSKFVPTDNKREPTFSDLLKNHFYTVPPNLTQEDITVTSQTIIDAKNSKKRSTQLDGKLNIPVLLVFPDRSSYEFPVGSPTRQFKTVNVNNGTIEPQIITIYQPKDPGAFKGGRRKRTRKTKKVNRKKTKKH